MAMKVIGSAGKEGVAVVYLADFGEGRYAEFVDAYQPGIRPGSKWVVLVSTMFGCPVGCRMCDAGGLFRGNAGVEDIFAQVDYMVRGRYPDGRIPHAQFKIQFARMGEPSLNPAVLDVLEAFPGRYQAPGFMPSLSTIAPLDSGSFFRRLLKIKKDRYRGGRFQFQFSIHTTDLALRDRFMPIPKWDFGRMAAYGDEFFEPGDRKISLNFALAHGMPVDPDVLLAYFHPDRFLLKITPLNPTYQAERHGLSSYIDPYREDERYGIVEALESAGYQVLVSIGEPEENRIGSNCGQYLRKHLEAQDHLDSGYRYDLRRVPE